MIHSRDMGRLHPDATLGYTGGARGSGFYYSDQIYEYQDSGIYSKPVLDFADPRQGRMRKDDIVVFKTHDGNKLLLNFGIVMSVTRAYVTFSLYDSVDVNEMIWDLDAARLRDLSITANKIADAAITSAKIAANAITSAKIADNAVTASKVANGAITGAKIASGAVTSDKLSAGAVTSDKIAKGAVGAEQIAPGSIGTEQLDPAAITEDIITDGSIGEDKISDGAITRDKMDPAFLQEIFDHIPEIDIDTLTDAEFMEYIAGSGSATGEELVQASNIKQFVETEEGQAAPSIREVIERAVDEVIGDSIDDEKIKEIVTEIAGTVIKEIVTEELPKLDDAAFVSYVTGQSEGEGEEVATASNIKALGGTALPLVATGGTSTRFPMSMLPIVPITKTDYDALPSSVQQNGYIYVIEDDGGSDTPDDQWEDFPTDQETIDYVFGEGE